MFKVVPDQLRISDGWVRCGQCDEVFDANAHLQAGTLVVEDPAPVPGHTFDAALSAELGATVSVATAVAKSSELTGEALAAQAHDSDRVPEPEQAHAGTAAVPEADAFLEENPHELPRFSEHLILPDPVSGPVEPSLEEESPPTTVEDPPAEPEAAQEPPAEELEQDGASNPQLSFMAVSSQRSMWTRPLVRGGLIALSLLLGLVLFLQVLVQERDRIAATEPGLRPFLMSVCSVLVCKISPPRQIESVVIDSSSFAKVRADVYRLNFTLKNTATIEVATPALELTLTDLQDQPVIRRVLVSGDFGAKQGSLAPGADMSVSLPLTVKLAGASERISGYRLLVFYP